MFICRLSNMRRRGRWKVMQKKGIKRYSLDTMPPPRRVQRSPSSIRRNSSSSSRRKSEDRIELGPWYVFFSIIFLFFDLHLHFIRFRLLSTQKNWAKDSSNDKRPRPLPRPSPRTAREQKKAQTMVQPSFGPYKLLGVKREPPRPLDVSKWHQQEQQEHLHQHLHQRQ